jgi:hypothetical protein
LRKLFRPADSAHAIDGQARSASGTRNADACGNENGIAADAVLGTPARRKPGSRTSRGASAKGARGPKRCAAKHAGGCRHKKQGTRKRTGRTGRPALRIRADEDQ